MASQSDNYKEALRRIALAKSTGATKLDLSELGLVELPPQFFELGQLTTLILSSNQIGEKGAAEVSRLRGLTVLDLSYNQIGDEGAAAVSQLSGLTTLNLSGNQIVESGAAAMSRLSVLTTLGLSGNRIGEKGAAEVSRLRGLTVLDLSYNQIGDEGAAAVSQLSGLTTLNLSGNQIGDRGAAAVSRLSGLTVLSLSDNRIGDEGAAAVSRLSGLTTLNLSSNLIGEKGVEAIAQLDNLTTLYLWRNQIGDSGAKALARLKKLTALDLSHSEIGEMGAQAVAQLSNLTELDLSDNAIGDIGAAAVAQLVKLTTLDLSNNGISELGANAMAQLVGLTRLYLSRNRIGDSGAEAVARLCRLITLYLPNNMIGDTGARALKRLNRLTVLNLSSNKIGDAGVEAVAEIGTLTELSLSGNAIQDITAIEKLTNLSTILLDHLSLRSPAPSLWRKSTLQKVDLKGSTVGDVPSEILDFDCLSKLRAYFDNLERGTPQSLRDVKVMILGNGQIGKTQLRRRLKGDGYDENVKTTHGVEIVETNLTAPMGAADASPTPLKIWDFGGQDVYLGTHALFLRSRAIFPILWTPGSEANESHVVGGFEFQNFPLDAWVHYVRELAGGRAPIILAQAQCDEPGSGNPAPVSTDLKDSLAFRPPEVAFSAKTGRNWGAMTDALNDAIAWLRKQQGVVRIGEGWARVKTQIETWIAEDKERVSSGDAKVHRTKRLGEFVDLCRGIGNVDSEDEARILLKFLHDIGTVFHAPETFDDLIILDQQWALNAIYSIFDRAGGAYGHLKDQLKGRFTRATLGRLTWDKEQFSAKEQEVFLSMMRACRICFVLRQETPIDGETLYIAPELLPDRAALQLELDERWDIDLKTASFEYSFDVMPPNVLRDVMAAFGNRAGLAAIYWRDGFQFYDSATKSRARIEQHRPEKRSWQGCLKIQTQKGDSKTLLGRLQEEISQIVKRMGLKPIAPIEPAVPKRRPHDDESGRLAVPAIVPGPEPTNKELCFISYAWGDDTDAGKLRAEAFARVEKRVRELGYAPLYDNHNMAFGESISRFMEMAATSPKAVLIVSDKYLRSPFCMYELHKIYQECRSRRADFQQRIRAVTLSDAGIFGRTQRLERQKYWIAERDRLAQLMNEYTSMRAPFPGEDRRDYDWICEFALNVSSLLGFVADTVHATSLDDVGKLTFDPKP